MGIRDDQDFQVVILDTVEPIENGWLVGYNGWMLFCPNENCTVPPQVHEPAWAAMSVPEVRREGGGP